MAPETPVTESINQRILELLGLEETFDLDYEDYLQLLKERLVRVTATNEKIADEDFKLLKDELKRVKNKKPEERKKKIKIKAEKLFEKKSPSNTSNKVSPQKLLPGSYKETPKEEKETPKQTQEKETIFERINKKLLSILDTLKSLNSLTNKTFEYNRRQRENKKREEKEDRLEKGGKLIKSAVQKMLAPFQSILDKIFNFIFYTLLGRAFTLLMNWLMDPKNKDKVKVLGRFLKDWWPALLAAVALFMTPFGGFVKGIVLLITGFSGKILKLIPQLANIIKGLGSNAAPILSNPMVWFPAAVAGTSLLANEITGQRKAAPVQAENKARAQTGKGLGVQGTDTMKDIVPSVGNMGSTTPYGLLQGASKGAIIQPGDGYNGIDSDTGIPITGGGQDTQLIAARPGEVVLTPQDQQAIYRRTGFDVANYVKNRKPNFVNSANIKLFGQTPLMNIGGIVGFNKGGIVGGDKAPNITMPDYHSLLAISALESDNPQGRSDVAQSIYNRLFAARNYGTNFNQTNNSLKDLIIAKDQYEPTFKNLSDWSKIKDMQSAAIAIMNSPKGRKYKWTMKDAISQLKDTELALKNPNYQAKSQKHVGGRAYFLGTSQHKNMKPGDVLRNEKDNFFSPWYLEGTPYDKERRNIAAPIPSAFIVKNNQQRSSNKSNVPVKKPNIIQRFASNIMNLFSRPANAKPVIKKQGGGLVNIGLGPTDVTKEKNNTLNHKKPVIKKQGGGLVNIGLGLIRENTGHNVSGETADRQKINHFPLQVQPGEYDFRFIVPKDAVDKGAVPLIQNTLNHIVASRDSNSEAAKLGYRNKSVRVPNITPYSQQAMSSMITLPPIKTSSSGVSQFPASGTGVPDFPTIPSSGVAARQFAADMYGIVN